MVCVRLRASRAWKIAIALLYTQLLYLVFHITYNAQYTLLLLPSLMAVVIWQGSIAWKVTNKYHELYCDEHMWYVRDAVGRLLLRGPLQRGRSYRSRYILILGIAKQYVVIPRDAVTYTDYRALAACMSFISV
jgi:hypothetical protein